MKKILFATSLFVMAAFGGEWTGTISDSKCAAKHLDASEKSQACVKGCVKGGAKAVLVTSDGKVLNIADQDKVADHLGHKVTVTGKLEGDTLSVDSVKM